jgi:protein-tyrosine phosphatase
MDIIQIDEAGSLFLSPDVDDWEPIERLRISAVFDMDGDLDIGVPTVPNHMLYVYFPIYDEELPDLEKLHAIARLGAALIGTGHRVLSHCGMGLNRSALMAGLILTYLGMQGADALDLLRQKRPGALYNENFANYLLSIHPA